MKYKYLALVFAGALVFSCGVDKLFTFLEAEDYKYNPITEIEVVIRQLPPLKSRLIGRDCTHPKIGEIQTLMDCMEEVERKIERKIERRMYRTDI